MDQGRKVKGKMGDEVFTRQGGHMPVQGGGKRLKLSLGSRAKTAVLPQSERPPPAAQAMPPEHVQPEAPPSTPVPFPSMPPPSNHLPPVSPPSAKGGPDRCLLCGADQLGLSGSARAAHWQACFKVAQEVLEPDALALMIAPCAMDADDAPSSAPGCAALAAAAAAAAADDHATCMPIIGAAGATSSEPPSRLEVAALELADVEAPSAIVMPPRSESHGGGAVLVESKRSHRGLPAAPLLWQLAASSPSRDALKFTCAPFADMIRPATSSTPTPEALTCAVCRHYILLEHGAFWDALGAAHCAYCASSVGLLAPRASHGAKDGQVKVSQFTSTTSAYAPVPVTTSSSSAAAAAGTGTGTSAAAAAATDSLSTLALADLSSAIRHLTQRLRRNTPYAAELREGMSKQSLGLADVAAQGVLCAFAEAEAICSAAHGTSRCDAVDLDGRQGQGGCGDEGDAKPCTLDAAASAVDEGSAALVFDELVRRWESHVPLSLLRLLQENIDGARGAGTAATSTGTAATSTGTAATSTGTGTATTSTATGTATTSTATGTATTDFLALLTHVSSARERVRRVYASRGLRVGQSSRE